MSTWSLEHIPAAGGASTFGSLKVWGIESFAWQRVNWGVDTLTVSVCGSAPAFSSAIWSYLDKIILWRDGVRFAQAWCTFSQANVQPHQTRTYTLQGPGWFLTQYAPSYDTSITIYTAGAYMALALGNAVAAGAPIAYASSVAAAIDVECPEVRTSSTILELLQRASRYAPLSAGWWDYSGETPVFHAARRGDLTALDLERSSYVSEPFSLSPRYDLQLKSVRLQFGWNGSTSYYYDTSGTDVELQGPNRLRVALSFSTPEAALKAAGAGIAAKLMADLGPLCWTGTIPLHDGASRIPDIRPGIAVNLTGTGCREEWATMAAVVQQVTYNHQLGTDTASVELGVPEHLGPQDYLEFASLAAQSSASAAGEDDTYQDPATEELPGGTFDDLDGSMFSQSPTVALEWCVAADYLTLPGFSEYEPSDQSGLSVPWKKYLTRNLSGSVELLSRVGPFVFSYEGYTATLSGAAKYTLGGAYSNTGLLTGVGDINQGSCSWPDGGASTEYNDCPNCADLPSPVTTLTSKVVTGATPTWSGSLRADLADEVTEDALIAYWLAATAAFSGWSSTAGVAAYEARTTSFQFYYGLLKGRGTGSNAVAGWTYTLEIPTEVRTYGSTGEWTAGESVTSEVVADSSGNFTLAEFEIRAPRGYERRPTGTCRVLTGIPSVDTQ